MGIFDKIIISLALVLLNKSFNVLPKWYCWRRKMIALWTS